MTPELQEKQVRVSNGETDKAECAAKGVDYTEPTFIETKSQRYVRRRKMKYSMDHYTTSKGSKIQAGLVPTKKEGKGHGNQSRAE